MVVDKMDVVLRESGLTARIGVDRWTLTHSLYFDHDPLRIASPYGRDAQFFPGLPSTRDFLSPYGCIFPNAKSQNRLDVQKR